MEHLLLKQGVNNYCEPGQEICHIFQYALLYQNATNYFEIEQTYLLFRICPFDFTLIFDELRTGKVFKSNTWLLILNPEAA